MWFVGSEKPCIYSVPNRKQSYDNEDKKIDYYCEQVKGTDIEVTEYETPETERNRYVAEFEYKKLHYCLSGELTKEEIENILKNLYFL